MVTTKKIITTTLKFLIGISSFLGVTLACVFAESRGYSNWSAKLLYFTQQSNIWIGTICLVMAVLSVVEMATGKVLVKGYMYVAKFIFTVSITVTGIIFCALLAPFAPFKVWSFSSVLTHVVAPVLAIIDFFADGGEVALKRSYVFLAMIPPSVWFAVTSVLCVLQVDFGRGDPFPYFFMDYGSEVGLWGFRMGGGIPQIGSVYWLFVIVSLIFGLSWLYYFLHPAKRKAEKCLQTERIKRNSVVINEK